MAETALGSVASKFKRSASTSASAASTPAPITAYASNYVTAGGGGAGGAAASAACGEDAPGYHRRLSNASSKGAAFDPRALTADINSQAPKGIPSKRRPGTS